MTTYVERADMVAQHKAHTRLAREIADQFAGKDMPAEAARQMRAHLDQAEQLRKALYEGEPQYKRDMIEAGAGWEADDEIQRHPLAVTKAALDDLQHMIAAEEAGKVTAAQRESKAAVTTGSYGAPRAWGANELAGPRLLHVVAGVPQQGIDALLAAFPKLTLPTATDSAAEGAALTEYDSSTAGTLTLGRFGRYTDLTEESRLGTSAGPLLAMHRLGIARDMDAVLIGAAETAAGTAVAFDADIQGNVRKSLARVADNTGAADVSRLVVLVNPDNADVLQDVAPIGGQTIAEGFTRFAGALVYASSAVTTGTATVANLSVGVRFYQAKALATASLIDPKTGVQTVATSTIGGYGVGLTGGFAESVEIVTA